MLSYLLFSGGDLRTALGQMLLCIPVILLALCTHEAFHGLVASWLGDPTAKNLGRITLNPVKHLDPIGFLCMLLCGFGWAKPVPINSRYFKKPRLGMALSALAGPVANLVLALAFGGLLKLSYTLLSPIAYPTERLADVAFYFLIFLFYGVEINVTLAVFNLLPIPPLDGSRLLYLFLPPKATFFLARNERWISLVIMLLLILGFLDPVLSFVAGNIMKGLFTVCGLRGTMFFPIL